MKPQDYGLVVLFFPMMQLSAALGCAGMETVSVRNRLGPSGSLFARVLISATLLGALAASALISLFNISTGLACIIVVAVIFSALNRMGCSFLQSLEHYRRGLGVTLAHNGVLLLATLLLYVTKAISVERVTIMLTLGYAITATYGWSVGRQLLEEHRLNDSPRSYARDGFTIMISQLAVMILNQLDRLLIPRLMSPAALGAYGAAATLCSSPFNLLQSGARFTLLPKLRACTERSTALRLLRSEAFASFLMVVLAGSGCILLAPQMSQWLFEGRYVLEKDLVVLLVLLGFLKVWDSFVSGCVQAMGTRRSLKMQSLAGWGGLAIALAGVFALEEMKLTSIVSAIAVGWLTLCIAGTFIAAQAAFATVLAEPGSNLLVPERRGLREET